MFGWLCNFIGHKDIHIAGNVWQCWRCKTCSIGQDLHAKRSVETQYQAPIERSDIIIRLRQGISGISVDGTVNPRDLERLEAATAIEQYKILVKEYMSDLEAAKAWRGPLRWDKMTDEDVCNYCFELAGALRTRRWYDQANAIQTVADDLYDGEIKPAPIIPATTLE